MKDTNKPTHSSVNFEEPLPKEKNNFLWMQSRITGLEEENKHLSSELKKRSDLHNALSVADTINILKDYIIQLESEKRGMKEELNKLRKKVDSLTISGTRMP